jgi:hypothetical protein
MHFKKKNIYFTIKFLLKRFIIYLSLLIVFLKVIKILVLIFFNKKKSFFLQEEGGFGHTITSPIYLDSILKNEWILIFCYTARRHNKAINYAFDNKILFLDCSPFYLEIDLKYRLLICNIIKKLSTLFFNIKIESIMEKLFNYSYISEKDNEYSKRFESRIWPHILKNKNNYILNDNLKKKFNSFSKNSNKKYKGKICFFVRNRMPQFKNINLNDLLYVDDISSILRESRNIEDYKFTITELIKENWQVYISGDFIEEPKWFNDFNNDLIFSSKIDLPKKLYNFLVGFYSDVIIGPASGGSLYNLFNFKKSLLLETSEVGCGYPYSMVSYPNILFNSKKEFIEIMVNKAFDWDKNFYLDRERIRPLNFKQITEICIEFVNNCHLDDYGVNPYDLGIKEGPLIVTRSRFSKKWLEIVEYEKLN